MTSVLRWWDTASTDLRLSVRMYSRTDLRILVDVHRARFNLPRSSALVSPTTGLFELIWAGRDNNIVRSERDHFAGRGWSSPRAITDRNTLRPATEPTSLARLDGQVDVFWVGVEGAIWWRTRPRGLEEWSPVQQITPAGVADASSRIRAVSRHVDHLDVFWANSGGSLYSAWMDANVDEGSWELHLFEVAGPGSVELPWSVFALAPNPECLHVFWIEQASHNLWTRVWRLIRRVADWRPAQSLFAATEIRPDSPITGVCVDIDVLDLFWIDHAGGVRNAKLTPTSAWRQVSTLAASAARGTDLSLSLFSDTELHLFFIDAGGVVRSPLYALAGTEWAFSSWQSIPTSLAAPGIPNYAIATADQAFGHTDVAFVQNDLSLGYASRDSVPFERITGPLTTRVSRSASLDWHFAEIMPNGIVRPRRTD